MTRRNIPQVIEVYRAIEKFQAAQKGLFPTYKQLIAAGVANSTAVVNYYFKEMEELGMLERVPFLARSSSLRPVEDWSQIARQYLEES